MSALSSLAAAQRHARDLQRSGDLPAARIMLEQAVRQSRAALGPDDPAVLAAAHQLAVVHRAGGDPAGARRILEEALPAGQRRLGDADPLMLGISFDLGRIAEDLENRHEARRAYGRVAAYGPNVLGEDHWAVKQARAYLGEDPPTVRLEVPDGGIEELRRAAAGPPPVTAQTAGVRPDGSPPVPGQRTPQASPAGGFTGRLAGATATGPGTAAPGGGPAEGGFPGGPATTLGGHPAAGPAGSLAGAPAAGSPGGAATGLPAAFPGSPAAGPAGRPPAFTPGGAANSPAAAPGSPAAAPIGSPFAGSPGTPPAGPIGRPVAGPFGSPVAGPLSSPAAAHAGAPVAGPIGGPAAGSTTGFGGGAGHPAATAAGTQQTPATTREPGLGTRDGIVRPDGPGLTSRPIQLGQPAPVFPPAAKRQRRPGAVLGGAVAAVLVVALLVWVAVQFLQSDGDGTAPVAGRPPTDVRLSDEGSDVRVLWADPADGTVPFIVSSGRLGAPLTARGETQPGRRTYLVQYLDPDADYCFTVGAKYSDSAVAYSPEVCTNRAAANPRRSN
ncbi:hypothetical protein Sya03_25010 [Spirilliplanes yamanashiensis]|uniref:Fibronectin type-III domain-containing protein n=1 Tax=Spirilliplanes yamanashiensis TaxID=42233 RepID=A0A8J4DJA5_9ACTN|nr:hypothetical protein Sya03_25010 [Spirilliplanes yamanashiensis]